MTDARPSHRLPVTILTGFLGSGKTTLLNRLLGAAGTTPVAVIVNELGSEGLDNLLVEARTEDMVLLDSGCVCCTVRNDLVDTLADLHGRRAAGSIPAFERAVVETTGLADPAPILHTLATRPEVSRSYFLDGLVVTVDALDGREQLARYPESVKQVAVADRVVLTKLDLAPPGGGGSLEPLIDRYNPGVEVVEARPGVADPATLFDVGLYDAARGCAAPARWLRDAACGTRLTPHAVDIGAFCIYRERPLSRAVLGMWLAALVRDFGDRLLRIKGLVGVEGAAGPLVVQAVQHRLYPPAPLPEWPSPDHRGRVVFITRGLDAETVEGVLRDAEAVLSAYGGSGRPVAAEESEVEGVR